MMISKKFSVNLSLIIHMYQKVIMNLSQSLKYAKISYVIFEIEILKSVKKVKIYINQTGSTYCKRVVFY